MSTDKSYTRLFARACTALVQADLCATPTRCPLVIAPATTRRAHTWLELHWKVLTAKVAYAG